MPLSAGAYTPPSPAYPAIPNTTILASDFNTIVEDLATALSLAIYKDGQASMAANLSMATFKVTNIGTGTNPADATNVLQVFTNPTFTGISGTGVVVTGTKATVTPAVLDLTVADINIAGTTLDIIVPTANITSSTALTFTSPDTSIVSSATADITATTSISFTAPTINCIGSLVATLATTTIAVTQLSSDSSTKVATTAFVQAIAFNAALPTLTGNNGKQLTITAGTVTWSDLFNATIMSFADGTDTTKRASLVLSGITAGQDRQLTVRDEDQKLVGATSTDALKIYDYTDATKIAKFQVSGFTTATTRTVNLADQDMTLFTPYAKLLSVVTASSSATVDVETTFDSTYDSYIIEVTGLTVQTNNVSLDVLFKIGGSYVTSNYNGTGTNIASVAGAVAGVICDAISNGVSACVNFTVKIPVVASTAFGKGIYFAGAIHGVPAADTQLGGAMTNSGTGAFTGIRFQASSGNILAGSFKLYGIRKT